MSKGDKSVVKRGLLLASQTVLPEFRRKGRSSFTTKSKARRIPPNQLNWHYGVRRKELQLRAGLVWIQVSSQLKKRWKMQYAVLYAERLCYTRQSEKLEDESDRECCMYKIRGKQIRVADIVSLKVLFDKHLKMSNSANTRNNICLKYETNGKQSELLLRFQSHEEMNEWMTALLIAKSSSLVKERVTSERLPQGRDSVYDTKL